MSDAEDTLIRLRHEYPALYQEAREKYRIHLTLFWRPASDPVPFVARACLEVGYHAGQRDAGEGKNIFADFEQQAQSQIEEPKQSEGDEVDAPGTSASLTHNPEDLTRLITNLKSGVSYDPTHIASVIESLHAAYVEALGRSEQ